jgi:hypothetical protein
MRNYTAEKWKSNIFPAKRIFLILIHCTAELPPLKDEAQTALFKDPVCTAQ